MGSEFIAYVGTWEGMAFREVKYKVKRRGMIINSILDIGVDTFSTLNRAGNRHVILASIIIIIILQWICSHDILQIMTLSLA